jgi:hypothetical protein
MAESLLITNSDVQEVRNIDAGYTVTRFNTFALEAQQINLRQALGADLYFDLISNVSESKYVTLLTGGTYSYSGNTIQFYGLKKCLVYWWLAIAAREGDLFLTNYGNVQFTNNTQQMFEQSKEKQAIAASYMEKAQTYLNDAILFLNANRSTYPLWKLDSENRQTKFITFKA